MSTRLILSNNWLHETIQQFINVGRKYGYEMSGSTFNEDNKLEYVI